MSAISLTKFIVFSSIASSTFPKYPTPYPSLSPKCPTYPLTHSSRKISVSVFSKPSEAEEDEELPSAPEDEWLKKLPDKKKPLYAHSLPCIEAWLRNLGFYQSKEDRAVWLVEKPEWHAQLSLDITDLYVRYLKTGPGNLEKDMERRFSYALSREDIENAVLGGP
ncbi:uncharacterized protein LOC126617218 [Malus sylvestris]|uniref:uncharacterized protein n=1 Tax=Malus domestica TaxID=3750 RepID=UPI0010AA7FEA|nr:uncharacterized protein LOC103443379 [Malus domestica]XP_050141208.1 uncharacterized protein LOC126617218 [Malus sylvestris]